jgi:hypothetical protein
MKIFKHGIIDNGHLSNCFGQKFYVVLKRGKICCTIFNISRAELGCINKKLAKNVMNAKLTFIPTISGPFNFDNRSGIENEITSFPKAEKVIREKTTKSKSIGDLVEFYTDKTSYIRSKQTGHKAITSCEHSKYGSAKRAPVNCEQDELLSLATTDAIINILSAPDTYRKTLFADSCIGIDFIHQTDNIGYCQKAFNHAITDLSRSWTAAKRPQPKDAVMVVDNQDVSVNPIDMIAANTFFARKEHGISIINRTSGKTIDGISVMVTDSDFHKQARKLLDNELLTVFDLKMEGLDESEIAEIMGCNIRTIGRMMVKIRLAIEPIGSELSDYVQKQHNSPAYSW